MSSVKMFPFGRERTVNVPLSMVPTAEISLIGLFGLSEWSFVAATEYFWYTMKSLVINAKHRCSRQFEGSLFRKQHYIYGTIMSGSYFWSYKSWDTTYLLLN